MSTSKQTGSAHVVIIIVLILAILGGIGYVAWRNLSRTSTQQVSVQTDIVHKDPLFTLSTARDLPDVSAIKAVEVVESSRTSHVLNALYDDGSTKRITTITGMMDPRALSVSGNTLYFIINDEDHDLFVASSIDLTKPEADAVDLNNFTTYYREVSRFCTATNCSTYPTQILADGKYLYHTQFSQTDGSSRVIRYDLTNGEPLSFMDEKDVKWYDYRIDLKNKKIFYALNGSKLYVANLDGTGEKALDTDYYGTGFLTDYLYNGSLVFGTERTGSPDISDTTNMSVFDYTTNTFTPINKTNKDFASSTYVYYIQK